MSEAPLPNDPASRTPTGEIKPPIAQETKPAETVETKSSPETKPEPKVGEDGKTLLTDKKPAAPAAPDKYEFKTPEGWDKKGWELDKTIIDQAVPIFKEMGLSQEAAQKLVNFYAEQSAKDHEALGNQVLEQNKKWQDEVKADPEIGGILPQVKQTVARALDSLNDPKLAASFREAMDLTGVGNHPAFIKAFYKLAQQVTEGKSVTGRGPSALGQQAPGAGPKTAAQALYPNLP